MRKLMNKIDRFCYTHPRFGIPNLMLIIVIGNAAVWLLAQMDTTGQIVSLLSGSAQGILHGQVWRLITYVFVPTESRPIWLLLMLYFYYWIGSCLEREWGNGKFTIYYVSGMLLTAIYGVVLSAILGRDVVVSTTYLNLSMFFAFATLYPDVQVLLFFIIKGLSGVVVYNALVIVVSLIFPLPTALAINGVGTAICLSVSYWIGRRTKTESLEQKLAEHPKLQKYFSATREYGFVSCFAIHLIGLSMEVLGILFGMLRIDFWTYLASSWLAIIPGMVCFTIAGAELNLRSPLFWLVLAIDGVLILFGILYTKKKILKRQES